MNLHAHSRHQSTEGPGLFERDRPLGRNLVFHFCHGNLRIWTSETRATSLTQEDFEDIPYGRSKHYSQRRYSLQIHTLFPLKAGTGPEEMPPNIIPNNEL